MINETLTARIGLDDTDHPEFGCTTYSFEELIGCLREIEGLIVKERRLVRLWPYASRRTRGNGALSAVVKIPMERNRTNSTLIAE